MYLQENIFLALCWHDYCSFTLQITRLASRGGRIRTSTRFRFIGGSVRIRGLAPAPFFIFLLCLTGGWPVRKLSFPRVCHRSGSVSGAPHHWGPSVFPGRPDYLFTIRGTPHSTTSAILLPLPQILIAPGKRATACGSADRCVPPIRRSRFNFSTLDFQPEVSTLGRCP